MEMIMLILLGMTGVFCIVFSKLKDKFEYNKKLSYGYFGMLALMCFSVKVVAASFYPGHATDMNCFSAWSQMLASDGFGAFYESEAFTDYPPGYMYILRLLGILKMEFNINEGIYYLILKLPAIICDIITGFLIYKAAGKRMSRGLSLTLSGLYMLLPAVVVNSSLWGQVDSVYTLGVVITLLLLSNKKLIGSFFVFAVCVFIKPQSLIFTPVLLFSAAEFVFLPEFKAKKLILVLLGGTGAILSMVLMALPFGLINVFNQYFNTIGSYPYLTVNAFNIWGAMGQNWTEITPYFSFVGMIFIVIITALSARVYFSNNGKEKYFTTAAFLIFSTFMFSVKMHDRYAFAAMIMLLFSFIYSNKKRIFACFALVSLMQFLNQAWVLFVYETDINYYADSWTLVISSIINIFIYLYTAYVLTNTNITRMVTKFPQERKASYLTRTDLLIVGAIAVIYSFVAFYNLGDMEAPKTGIKMRTQDMIRLELDEVRYVDSVNMYIGPEAIEEDVYIDYFADGEWVFTNTLDRGDAFYWNKYQDFVLADEVVITTDKVDFEVFEVVLRGEDGIVPIKYCEYESLTDEQYLYPDRVTNLNSTYFDEIYHARTAYEFIEGEDVYEWTHPPLGKVFIALGVRIFGMNPFGWRVIGTVFGILMVFVIYVFLKRMFKNTFISVIGCIMFTFDFMHFTQTRLATIDVYVTFFIMLMYFFMYKYYTLDFKKVSLKESFVPLFLAGLSFGLGAASKWTACYACAGLAVIFLITVIRRYIEVREGFWGWFFKTSAFCVLVFNIIPILIYILSYIPYMRAENDFSLSAIWENQKDMLIYHGKTVVDSTHPFSSEWYKWPVMYRPIWYYSGELTDTVKEGISAFGNPAVWWLGIPSFLVCAGYAFIKRNKKAIFIVIGYMSNLLPWVFVTRTTYIYHYFPLVAFSVLMTCFSLSRLEFKSRRVTGALISAAVIILFLMFYPVLSGAATPVSYVKDVLRWFDSWVLIG